MAGLFYTYSGSETFREIPKNLRRTVEPTDLPVSLAEVKRALDLGDTTSEDTELMELIPVAVEMVERDSRRAIQAQTWQLQLDEFPSDEIQLWICPVTAVSVTYTDQDGNPQTHAASLYDVDTNGTPGRIVPSNSSTGWPTTQNTPNAVTVTFTAGYSTPIPRVAWKAIMFAAKSLYHGCDVGNAYWSMIGRLRWEAGL